MILFFRQEFIDLYVDLLLKSGVEKHFNPFSKGFHNVCGGRIMKLFRSHELMAVVVGEYAVLHKNTNF